MITSETKKLVSMACRSELANARGYGALFNTTHEGYAVLKEETEEAADNLRAVERCLNEVWQNVKDNDREEMTANLITLKSYALLLVYEAVQVCAVTEKFLGSSRNE